MGYMQYLFNQLRRFGSYLASADGSFYAITISFSFTKAFATEIYTLGGLEGVAYMNSMLGYTSAAMVAGCTLFIPGSALYSLSKFSYRSACYWLSRSDKDTYNTELRQKQVNLNNLPPDVAQGIDTEFTQRLFNILQAAPDRAFDEYGACEHAGGFDKLTATSEVLVMYEQASQADDKRQYIQQKIEEMEQKLPRP